MKRLKNKVAIITGGAVSFGLATDESKFISGTINLVEAASKHN